MDIDINKVLLVGALEEIGELRTFPSGSTLCPITIVTVERFNRRGGEVGERKSFHKVTIWGELGKRVHAEFSRGMRVAVEGRLNRRSYEKDGETRWFTDIVASSCSALGSAPSSYSGAGQGSGQSAYSGGGRGGAHQVAQPHGNPQRNDNRQSYTSGPSQPPPPQTQPPPPAAAPDTDSGPLPDGEDDLPF